MLYFRKYIVVAFVTPETEFLAMMGIKLSCKIFVFRRTVVECRGKTRLTGWSRRIRGGARATLRRRRRVRRRYCDWGRRMSATTCRQLQQPRLPASRQQRPHHFTPSQKLQPTLLYVRLTATDADWLPTYDLLLTFHSNRGPMPYRFRDQRRFQSKITTFPPPCI